MDSEESGELPEEPRARPRGHQQSDEANASQPVAEGEENEQGQPALNSTSMSPTSMSPCLVRALRREVHALAKQNNDVFIHQFHVVSVVCCEQSLLRVDGTLRMMKKRQNQSNQGGVTMSRGTVLH